MAWAGPLGDTVVMNFDVALAGRWWLCILK